MTTHEHPPMLQISTVTKKFGKTTAVDAVDLTIPTGNIYSLIGPNGSGKTTIVKMICGLLQPTNGTIVVNAFNVVTQPVQAKKSIGYIPDEPSIWPSMTGMEFLHFTGELYSIDEKSRAQEITKLLALFQLENIAHNFFEDYSRGNKQKFAIMAALMHMPKLLVIDEPIVGLDPTSADIVKQKFIDYAKAGGTIFLVTHTLPVAQEISHRIGVLRDGHLVAEGSFAELRDQAHLPASAHLHEVYQSLAS
jgi:ABC-2 type transport system ATP-binding protein